MKNCKNCKKEILRRGTYCMNNECQIVARKENYKNNLTYFKKKGKERYKKEKDNPEMYKHMREINQLAKEKARFGASRESILQRFNYECGYCPNTKNLIIHHIDEKGRSKNVKTPNNDIENLIACCRRCHSLIHVVGMDLIPKLLYARTI